MKQFCETEKRHKNKLARKTQTVASEGAERSNEKANEKIKRAKRCFILSDAFLLRSGATVAPCVVCGAMERNKKLCARGEKGEGDSPMPL